MNKNVLDGILNFNIYRVSILFRRELAGVLSEYGLTPEQWRIMIALWHKGHPLNQNEIVYITMKDKPTVSRMIRRLENNGWIEKRKNASDGRVQLIQLTEKGEKYKDEIPRKARTHFRKLLKDLNIEEKEIMVRNLEKIRDLLGD